MSKNYKDLVVIAIGGNSLITDAAHRSVLDQYTAAGETARHIANIVEEGYRVLITHGNGPQVGFILLRSELARDTLHQVPLESCVADTQGAIGYQVEQTIANALKRRGIEKAMATLVTQVVVDPEDPAFQNPTKPIGPFFTREEAEAHAATDGWRIAEEPPRGWRRVVPSPKPLHIVEEQTIRLLLEHDVLVVAAGGGGIPVVRSSNGELSGVAAVIDKDAATCLLARNLNADYFVLSTGVHKVALNYGKPDQQWLDTLTLDEARRYLAEGHFPPGSMGPKIQAAIDFLEGGGKRVIIAQPQNLEDALHGITGTHIIKDS